MGLTLLNLIHRSGDMQLAKLSRNKVVKACNYIHGSDISASDSINRAIEACELGGGGEVLIGAGVHFLHRPILVRSGVSIVGEGSHLTRLELLPECIAGFWDSNIAKNDVTIHGFKVVGNKDNLFTTRSRGIWLDAQGKSKSKRIKLFDLIFEYLFRGVEIDHVVMLAYDRISGFELADSLIYIGETPENCSRSIRHGSVFAEKCMIAPNNHGGGAIVIAYTDDVVCVLTNISSSGPATGKTNLFHALYFRSVRRARFGTLNVRLQKRGAALHIYSDPDRSEPYNEEISGTVVGIDIIHYSGVRIDRCRRCRLVAGWSITRAGSIPVMVTNSSDIQMR